MPSPLDRAGSRRLALDRLGGALDLAREWAGDDRLALIVSGTHAVDDGVWTAHAGRPVSISDLDLYAVVPDLAARGAAIARARAAKPGLGARLLAMGLAAPMEVGFHTPDGLGRLPARPGTLELRRSGRVVDGDPAWLARVPAWTARDVSAEETWLLLENRAFELLWASHAGPGDAALMGLRRRHAVLKCALDLATVLALAAGEYPAGAAARVAWARPRWDRDHAAEPPWEAAMAWREGEVTPLAPAAAAAERLRTVAAWVAVWRRLARDPADPARPFASVARVARRARWRRRLREALLPDASVARLAVPGGRIRLALAGTPRHRLHAAAAAQLIFEAVSAAPAGRGTMDSGALRRSYHETLAGLGVTARGDETGAALARAWDRGFLDGQRTEGWT